MRLPLGTLFAVGALLLAALAVVFSGHGLRALQEAGAIAATHFGVFDAPAFGVYATRETLGAQLMVLAFVIAAFFLRRRPTAAPMHLRATRKTGSLVRR